jgi:hypothetical protein
MAQRRVGSAGGRRRPLDRAALDDPRDVQRAPGEIGDRELALAPVG